MPKLNYTTPLHTFSTGNLTYTATKTCYIVGTVARNTELKINNNSFVMSTLEQYGNKTVPIPMYRIDSGDVVVSTIANPNLFVLEEKQN